MKEILLIAANFVRMQWLTLAVMSAYLLGISGVFAYHQQVQEARFFFQMHSFYLLLIALMVAVPVVHAERRSRRILAVLSKGIHRWQYLGGILCGSAIISAIFCALLGAIILMLCFRGGYSTVGLGGFTVALFACCMMASATGLFYSTFLHPLLATGAATITLALPFINGTAGWRSLRALFPVFWLADKVTGLRFGAQAGTGWITASAAVLAIVFWTAGAAIFARRDVTTSPE